MLMVVLDGKIMLAFLFCLFVFLNQALPNSWLLQYQAIISPVILIQAIDLRKANRSCDMSNLRGRKGVALKAKHGR